MYMKIKQKVVKTFQNFFLFHRANSDQCKTFETSEKKQQPNSISSINVGSETFVTSTKTKSVTQDTLS